MCLQDWAHDDGENGNPGGRKRKHKRLKTAYELFLAEYKKTWRREHPGVPFEEAEARCADLQCKPQQAISCYV